jgi:hypothetical protein
MNREDIIRMAHESHLDVYGLGTDYAKFADALERFAALVEEHIYAKQLELPEPRLTGKFSITAGNFKCTGCTGTWTDREDAKHHSCKDYQ